MKYHLKFIFFIRNQIKILFLRASDNDKGMAVLMIVITAALLSTMLVTNIDLIIQQRRQVYYINSKIAANIIRDRLSDWMDSSTAIDNTFAHTPGNQELCWLNRGVDCDVFIGNVQSLGVIYSVSNEVLFDFSSSELGFSLDIESCNTFHAQNGNQNCPFRYDIAWKLNCSDQIDCSNKGYPIIILADLVFSPGRVIPFNTKFYRLETGDL